MCDCRRCEQHKAEEELVHPAPARFEGWDISGDSTSHSSMMSHYESANEELSDFGTPRGGRSPVQSSGSFGREAAEEAGPEGGSAQGVAKELDGLFLLHRPGTQINVPITQVKQPCCAFRFLLTLVLGTVVASSASGFHIRLLQHQLTCLLVPGIYSLYWHRHWHSLIQNPMSFATEVNISPCVLYSERASTPLEAIALRLFCKCREEMTLFLSFFFLFSGY